MLPLLHISLRIRSIMCTTIAVQTLLYKYCFMQCNVLFSHVKHCVLKITLEALFWVQKQRQIWKKDAQLTKRNFKIKIYINSFCLMSQLLFFFRASSNFANMTIYDGKAKLALLPREQRESGWINCKKYIINLTSRSECRHFSSTCR